MAPDVWQVTLGVTNKSLKKLRGEIGDKAKLLKYNTAGIIIFSKLETKLVFICLVRIKFSQCLKVNLREPLSVSCLLPLYVQYY